MTFRDPDLGRDRETRALGRRDYGFFTPTDNGLVRADRQPAAAPWAEHPDRAHDRWDRTLGIPDRATPMWPASPLSLAAADTDPVRRAEAVCDELCAQPPPVWRWPDPQVCAALVGDAASVVYGRSDYGQRSAIAAAARRHGVHPIVAHELVTGVGSLVGQTAHRRAAAVPGVPSVNLAAGADPVAATELFLARERLRLADALSDPDLPRLWIMANGLAHGVPAAVMRRMPARSMCDLDKAPGAHDDLVGWDGARGAVEHLRDVVRAAVEGRRWLHSPERERTERLARDEPTSKNTELARGEMALGLGVVGLTRPAAAFKLARFGVARLTIAQLREVAGPAPAGVLDLSDAALKAVCDRNGWLRGGASERTLREVVERHDPSMEPGGLRAALAAGRASPRDAFGASVPDDAALDGHAFRKNPPASDAAARGALVGAAGREAIRRFAEVEPPYRASFADAVAHRFPERRSREVLRESDPTRLVGAAPVAPTPSAIPLELDLGL